MNKRSNISIYQMLMLILAAILLLIGIVITIQSRNGLMSAIKGIFG